MRLSARGLLASPWSGALLAFLAVGVVWPSSARAGCSAHYVTSRSQAGADTAHLGLLGTAGALPAPLDETPRERPAPCSGAMCSGNPAPTPTTAPSVPTQVGGQWAIAASTTSHANPAWIAWRPLDATLGPLDSSLPIFHPPRDVPSATPF